MPFRQEAAPAAPAPFVPPVPPPPEARAAAAAAAAKAAPPTRSAVPAPALVKTQESDGRRWVMGIFGIAFLVFVLAAGLVAMKSKVNSPHFKATAALWDAEGQLERKEWDQAVASCRVCIKHDGAIAEASFIGGLACLQLTTGEDDSDTLDKMVEDAKWGRTASFDDADAWLKDCIQRCDEDLDRKTLEPSLVNNRRMKASAQTLLVLTALCRASAAMDAGQVEDGEAWLKLAGDYLQQAERTDPDCRDVKEARKVYSEITKPQRPAPQPAEGPGSLGMPAFPGAPTTPNVPTPPPLPPM